MLIPFDQMPKNARVWIYQSSRLLTDQEVELLIAEMNNFLMGWQTHGQSMQTSGQVLYNRFLILAVDEDHLSASGCSIDGSVRFVQSIGNKLSTDWFSRTDIAFKQGDEVMVTPAQGLKQKISEGEIEKSTLTFNNLVKNIEEFESGWLVPAEETWVNRYFKN